MERKYEGMKFSLLIGSTDSATQKSINRAYEQAKNVFGCAPNTEQFMGSLYRGCWFDSGKHEWYDVHAFLKQDHGDPSLNLDITFNPKSKIGLKKALEDLCKITVFREILSHMPKQP